MALAGGLPAYLLLDTDGGSSASPHSPASPFDRKSQEPNAGNGADLPAYSWTQTLAEVVASFPVPPGTRGRDCAVSIGRGKLSVGLRGQPPLVGERRGAAAPWPAVCIALPSLHAPPLAAVLQSPVPLPLAEGELYAAVKPDDSCWNLVDGRLLEVNLRGAREQRAGGRWPAPSARRRAACPPLHLASDCCHPARAAPQPTVMPRGGGGGHARCHADGPGWTLDLLKVTLSGVDARERRPCPWHAVMLRDVLRTCAPGRSP